MRDSDENKDAVEIWGGLEYSYVRVKNSVYDQLARIGYENSTIDLELFSELNIKTIRYPLLWEKYSADIAGFFRLNDHRLNKLMELGIKPVASLMHHGSGPFNTSLYDNDFPQLLAEFAYRIAERYPWLNLYTPVNEPLTTARFSGLYGIWYPHMNNDHTFLRMFVNELKGIVLSMQAAKSINPGAKLIQTEDISKIHSSSSLRYQADFENERRWMTNDILLGKFTPDHPLWKYVTDSGINDNELEFFRKNITEPAVMGFNYYATSERYLDSRKKVYPECYHGGNGFEEYADVEAVRANIPVTISPGSLLREAWERYHLPVALTEVHLACTREEQIRWFYEAYQNAVSMKKEGVDIRAITAWSFFGSYDWSTLLCQKNNHYESGVYDIRSGMPRATALAGLIKSIKSPDGITANLLQTHGWWRREDRAIFKPEGERIMLEKENTEKYSEIQPLLIVGANGSLGNAIARICDVRGIRYYLSGRSELDIASEESVKNMLEDLNPWGVINAAGYTMIDEAENAAFTCFRENTIGPVILAETCRKMGIKFVTFSSDQVFNGKKKKPYTELDFTNPLNFYGLSKKFAEEKVIRINPDSLIIRSSSFFNPWHNEDSLGKILQAGAYSDQRFNLATDIIFSPAYVPDLVNSVLDLMIDQESGIWHLSSQEEISYYDFARKALQIAGLNESIITPVPAAALNYTAKRPSYSVLRSSAGLTLPLIRHSLTGFINEFLKEPINQFINQPSL